MIGEIDLDKWPVRLAIPFGQSFRLQICKQIDRLQPQHEMEHFERGETGKGGQYVERPGQKGVGCVLNSINRPFQPRRVFLSTRIAAPTAAALPGASAGSSEATGRETPRRFWSNSSMCGITRSASARAADVADPDRVTRALIKNGYSPPEQYNDTSTELGAWTDIYALAATLRRAIADEVPADAMSRLAGTKLAPLAGSPRVRGFRPAFLDALDQALALDRNSRPQSIAEWRGAFFAKGAPAPRKRVDHPALAATVPFERPDEMRTVPELDVAVGSRSARKSAAAPWVAVAGAGLALLAGGVASVVLMTGDRTSDKDDKETPAAVAPVTGSEAPAEPAGTVAAKPAPAPGPADPAGDEVGGGAAPEPAGEPAAEPERDAADGAPTDATVDVGATKAEPKVAALEQPAGSGVDPARRLGACETLSGGAAEAACLDVAASSAASPAQKEAANLRLGSLLQKRGANAQARAVLARVSPAAMTPEALNLRGALAAAAGDYDAAVPDLSEAVRRAPQNGEYRNNRAWVYLQQGKLVPAEIDADLAVRHLPSAAYVWDTRGHIREKLGRLQDAAADYRRALGLDANLETSRAGLARVGAR